MGEDSNPETVQPLDTHPAGSRAGTQLQGHPAQLCECPPPPPSQKEGAPRAHGLHRWENRGPEGAGRGHRGVPRDRRFAAAPGFPPDSGAALFRPPSWVEPSRLCKHRAPPSPGAAWVPAPWMALFPHFSLPAPDGSLLVQQEASVLGTSGFLEIKTRGKSLSRRPVFVFTCKKVSSALAAPPPLPLGAGDCLEGVQGASVTPGASSGSPADASAGRKIRWPGRGRGGGGFLAPLPPGISWVW